MNNRRTFIRQLCTVAGTALVMPAVAASFEERTAKWYNSTIPEDTEAFWNYIRESYTVSPTIINLNNGGVSPQPRVVQEAVETYTRLCNEAPSYYMWRVLDKGRESLRDKLAALAGCSADELSICRNTTEALETIIFGLQLKKGDEVVLCKYDYPHMLNAWKQRAQREGIVLKWVDIPMPIEDDNEITALYEAQVSAKTKIVHVTHMINYTGQLLPVKAIAEMAHKHGAEVVVDAAHSFVHDHFAIRDLDADYLGTSLHKWLCAPFGTGMIWVRKEKIAGLYAAFPSGDPLEDNIRKFEHLGTRNFPTEFAIGHAIDFHNMIGGERKTKRLRWLSDYWINQVKEIPGFKLYTSRNPKYGLALATFTLEGHEVGEIATHLFRKHGLHTTSINHEAVQGVRVSPNVYTAASDLDRLVQGIRELAG